MATFTPINTAQVLQEILGQLVHVNEQLGDIRGELGVISARSENLRILVHNCHNAIPSAFELLLKTHAGDGVQLAVHIFGHIQNVQHFFVPPAQPPNIGTQPQAPVFHTNFHLYQRADIINLIIFYNETFGINAGDNLQVCITKFQTFLVAL
ncbi:hypothetical protein EDB86DRAFT_2805903 [Lactarius hatsudake]|nr:hypothetical protein EDB86DRAFT_2805903 [Lactarius hatsudake]